MANLLFSLGVTMPVFLIVVLGYVFGRTGLVDEFFAKKINDFVFQVLLPVTLFQQLATNDFLASWDVRFVLFCFGATVSSIFLMILLSKVLAPPAQRGEFIQGSYRASQALLGMAYLTNLYGNAEYVPMMLIVSVILYNISAVIILDVYAPGRQRAIDRKEMFRHVGRGIMKNPLIIGIVAGAIWSVLRLPMGTVLSKVVSCGSLYNDP